MNKINNDELVKRIYSFLDKYAKIKPIENQDEDDEYHFNSPDAFELLYCAKVLSKGEKPVKCFSDWGSGGYEPYTSKEGFEEHQYLIKEIYKIINS